jgi:lipopolysaccharide biosynthesis protein
MNIRRIFARATLDILPGVTNKLLGPKPQPRGRERAIHDEWSMAVPFHYQPGLYHDRVAVVCHMFHADLAAPMLGALADAEMRADLLISTDTEAKAAEIRSAAKGWNTGAVTVRIVENRGRDIAPKLITFADDYAHYDLLLFLHSKKSETVSGDGWREYLMSCLCGASSVVSSIQEIFRLHPDVGMVIPPHYPPLRDWVEGLTWANNFRRARRLAWDMDIDIGEDGVIDFPSGSMFWARPAALNPLLDLGLSFSDFPPEPLPLDGTLAHQIERLFLFSCEKAGLKWLKALNEEVAIPEQRRESIGFPADISAFIRRHSFELLKYQPN